MSLRDNPTTMTTDVEVEHILEYIQRAVIGENMWHARIVDGISSLLGTWSPVCRHSRACRTPKSPVRLQPTLARRDPAGVETVRDVGTGAEVHLVGRLPAEGGVRKV